jgi:hypothetical protein
VKVFIAETIHQLKSVCLEWRRLAGSSKRRLRRAVMKQPVPFAESRALEHNRLT